MSVKVIVTGLNPATEPESGPVSGYINFTLTGDYLSPVQFQFSGSAYFNEKKDRKAGIIRALKKIEELGRQISEGASEAMKDHPPGS